MKRERVAKLFMAYGLALGIAFCPAVRLDAQAVEAFATVEGTVLSTVAASHQRGADGDQAGQ